MDNDTITEGVEETRQMPALVDNTMAATLVGVEIDKQISTAKQYPRSVKTAIDNILSLATLDEETAAECIYALPRGGKPVRGPSIRLAETIQQQWGNNRVEARVIQIDRINKVIVAEGMFIDLETNSATRACVQRRISGKNGSLFNDDMINITGNAACSIAKRNAILAGVPKGVWRKAVEACEQIIRGDTKTLSERRESAIAALAHFGLTPEQIFKLMEAKGVEDIDIDDLATLRVIYTSLKNGEQTVEELLRGIEPDKGPRVTPATAKQGAPEQFAADVPSADKAPSAAPAAPAPAQAEADPKDVIMGDLIVALGECKDMDERKRLLGTFHDFYNSLDAERRTKVNAALNNPIGGGGKGKRKAA